MLKCLARTGPRPQRCNKHGCGTGPRQVRYGACSHTPVGQGSARFAWSADELPINTKTKYFSAVPSNNGCHARLHLEDSVSAHNAQLPIRRRRARDKHKRARLNQQRNIRDPHESPTLRVAHQNRNSHYIARLCEHKCFNVGRLAFGAAAPRHHLFKITAVCACEDFHFARTVSPARQKKQYHGARHDVGRRTTTSHLPIHLDADCFPPDVQRPCPRDWLPVPVVPRAAPVCGAPRNRCRWAEITGAQVHAGSARAVESCKLLSRRVRRHNDHKKRTSHRSGHLQVARTRSTTPTHIRFSHETDAAA